MKNIAIIGGGIGGMYSAMQCNKLGYTVHIIEKNYRLGGRIYTDTINEVQIETGAGRFNDNHTKLLKLLKHYKIEYTELKNKKDFIPIIQKDCRKEERININALINKVLRKASTISDEELMSITFNQLCEIALGIETTRALIEAFGYNAEFYITNAFSGVKTFKEDFTNKYKYYSCVNGLSSFISLFEEDLIKKGVNIHKGVIVNEYMVNKDNTFTLKLSDNSILIVDDLIFALPKNELMKIDIFSNYARSLFDSVSPVSLHRIYANYRDTWFKDIIKTTTDIPIRQFIPIDYDKSVAMVSYSDLHDADYWNIINQGTQDLEETIRKQLKQMFPDKKITKAVNIRSYYWDNGVHAWKPGVNPIDVMDKLQKLIPNVYIVGEAYSMRQGWIEGALETADVVINIIKNKVNNKKQKRGGKKEVDINEIKNEYPNKEWVILDIGDGEGRRIVDITDWKNLHPGGDKFTENMYKDITNQFTLNTMHYTDTKLKNHVSDMVNKYTLKIIK
jgi:hypothetical protein